MPIVRIPPQQAPNSSTQISTDAAAAPGRAIAGMGRAVSDAEAQSAQAMQQAIGQLAGAFGGMGGKAAGDESYVKNLVNNSKIKMAESVAGRLQQTVDKDGNPTYGALVSDVTGITNDIISDSLSQIPDARLRMEAEARLRSTQSNFKIKSLGAQRDQQIDFTRSTTSTSIAQTVEEGKMTDTPIEKLGQQIQLDLDRSMGAFSFQEQAKIKQQAAEQISLGRVEVTLNSGNQEAIANMHKEIDNNPYLSTESKLKVKEESNKVLLQLEKLEEKENFAAEMDKRISKGQSIADLDKATVNEVFEAEVKHKSSVSGRPLSIKEKAAVSLRYKGAQLDSLNAELDNSLKSSDAAKSGEALDAYLLMKTTSRSNLSKISDESKELAEVAQTKLLKNKDLTFSQAMKLAQDSIVEIDPETRKKLLGTYNKEFKDPKAFQQTIRDDLDSIINNDSFLDVFDPDPSAVLTPQFTQSYNTLLKEAYVKFNGDMDAARASVKSTIVDKVGVSKLSENTLIFNPPELNPRLQGIDSSVIKDRIKGDLVDFGDKIDLDTVFITSDALSVQMSDQNVSVYKLQTTLAGEVTDVMRQDPSTGVETPVYIRLDSADIIGSHNIIKSEEVKQQLNQQLQTDGLSTTEIKDLIMTQRSLFPGEFSVTEQELMQKLDERVKDVQDLGDIIDSEMGITAALFNKTMRWITGETNPKGPEGQNVKTVPGEMPHTLNPEASAIKSKLVSPIDDVPTSITSKLNIPNGTTKETIKLTTGRDTSKYVNMASELSTSAATRTSQLLHTARLVFPNNETMAQLATLQALLESGSGESISGLAKNHNNLFGIKGVGSGNLPTTEFIAGVPKTVGAEFRSYKSVRDSFEDYAKLIETNPTYAKVAASKNLDEAIQNVHLSPYATDPQYAVKLKQLQQSLLVSSLKNDKVTTPKMGDQLVIKDFQFAKDNVTMKHLSTINVNLASKVSMVMAKLEAKGWQPRVAEGVRDVQQQAQKVAKGYSRTMKSRHLHGEAVDIVDKRYGWNGPASDTNFQFWKDLAEAVKEVGGMTSGSTWKSFKDVAHVQLD